MSFAKAGILEAGAVTTSCASEDNVSDGGGNLTLIPIEGGGDGEKRGAVSFLPE